MYKMNNGATIMLIHEDSGLVLCDKGTEYVVWTVSADCRLNYDASGGHYFMYDKTAMSKATALQKALHNFMSRIAERDAR